MKTTPNTASSFSLHPALWIAGISVTLLSLVGIASLTGLLPAKSAPNPVQPAIVAAAPAIQPTVQAAIAPETPVAAPLAPSAPASKAPPEKHQKTAKKKVHQEISEISATPAAAPPPPGSGVPPDYVQPPPGSGVPPDYVPPPDVASAPPSPPPCPDCGAIANVRQVTNEGQGSGVGAILGGVVGGALANNIGKGNGRALATIAGALGGGMLGNTIEKSQRRTVGYQVTVRMEDGTTRLIDSDTAPPWRIGDQVKLVGGAIVPR